MSLRMGDVHADAARIGLPRPQQVGRVGLAAGPGDVARGLEPQRQQVVGDHAVLRREQEGRQVDLAEAQDPFVVIRTYTTV